MVYEDTDLYSSPKTSGLALLAEIEVPGQDYSFDLLVVWRHIESGKLFWAADEGCSCPSPFEDYYFRGPSDTTLEPLTAQTFAAFERALTHQENRWDVPYGTPEERSTLIRLVRSALAGAA